ncbi:Acyl-CoA dehydrogenase, C-terminal:Acyl-CoA dehydrogenase, centralregion:Acyl-CoA dehydrogenase, N-terminal [Pseudooceanicola batsensis HTCC2597]|uniref:Acyl-CoA dehydrogenase, C-terminal:Acyl-CoA dehydrogenase, centralregion:Acyl-CoA dehydrogenase, N-terminal n=1 Tax=Pseudooceanicola batsensis (strain ATCC BAA-863 / DSM 15984 / KCTC 12145 / HTCC2597) TaxID=252305 RepID=A3TZ86_PSEBH|nr:acyl-CoA dehydrogenase family protein [Pseudooceanicola batsensis]EAQ02904.1 Acyl-CoA dehydrogenase, C-terminal:Acyl-CoA dehydrogenase, centralregion:Acyl-CoA dehydrogenase, N-terminal [Pseudooceanicola batsensis HTCC2597]
MPFPRTHLEPEHEMFRDQVRRYLKAHMQAKVPHWRTQGHVDREDFTAFGANGWLCLWAGEEYGGPAIRDIRYDQVLQEETIRWTDIGFFHNAHSMLVGPYLDRFATSEQKARFLPGAVSGETIMAIAMTEPDTGSDLAAIRTRAEDRGDHYLLNGSKTYISNGVIGDLFVVAARTGEKRGRIGLFVVMAGMEGFSLGRHLKKMGLPVQDTAEIRFDDVRVPKENLLGDPGMGFAYMAECLAVERTMSAISSLSHAQAAFDITLEFVKERRAFGKPVGAFQNTRFVMADLRARLDAAQAYLDQCVVLANDERLTPEDAAAAKLLCSEVQGDVVDAGLQLHGGAGYMDEYEISHMFRDARIARIYAGTSEIMKEIIGRGLGLGDRDLT